MPRIPYLTDEQIGDTELARAIRSRRGGQLLELDRLLLHSPPVAEGWNHMMGNVRSALTLDARTKELAMCAVAVFNGADYELMAHSPLYMQAGGTQAQLDALVACQPDLAAIDGLTVFDANARAVLKLVMQSTCQVKVDAAVFDAARAALGEDRLVFELVMVTASYNMVSRILVALDVHKT